MTGVAGSWKSRHEPGRFLRHYGGRCITETAAVASRAAGSGSAPAHHIRHWAQGGPTTLSNLAMLCRRHHRAVHEEGYQVALLRALNDAEGLVLDAHTATPGWLGERLDVGYAIDVLHPLAR